MITVSFSSALTDSLAEAGLHMPGRDQLPPIAGIRPTAVELERTLMRLGRNDAPRLLAALAARGVVDTHNGVIVGSVWSDAEHPEQNLPRSGWRALFSISGYADDSVATSPPTEPLRLYRGATHSHRDGWSWTDNAEIASRFASGAHYGRSQGSLWSAIVDPDRLFCRNPFREESEYVVDTAGLTIELLPG